MNTRNRLAPPLNSIDRDDVEEGVLLSADVASYLQLDNSSTKEYSIINPIAVVKNINYGHEIKNGLRVVYAENIRSRELTAIRTKIGEVSQLKDHDDDSVDDNSDDDTSPLLPPPLSVANKKRNASAFLSINKSSSGSNDNTAHIYLLVCLRAFYFFFQGILAGFCFSPVYVESVNSDTASLLLSYLPMANEFRRLLYVLATISVVGSLDTVMTTLSIMKDKFKRSQGSTGILALNVLTLLLHLAAFIITIAMAKVDTLIALQFGLEGSSTWTTTIASSSVYSSDISAWRGMDKVRFICAMVAWVGCCLNVCSDIISLVSKGNEVIQLTEVASAWRKRTSELEGGGLGELDVSALRKLVALQTVGLERSKDALSVYASSNI